MLTNKGYLFSDHGAGLSIPLASLESLHNLHCSAVGVEKLVHFVYVETVLCLEPWLCASGHTWEAALEGRHLISRMCVTDMLEKDALAVCTVCAGMHISSK